MIERLHLLCLSGHDKDGPLVCLPIWGNGAQVRDNALYQHQCALTLNNDATKESLPFLPEGWSLLQTYLQCCHTNPWVYLAFNRNIFRTRRRTMKDLAGAAANNTTSRFTRLVSAPLISTSVLQSIMRITYPGETVKQQQSLAGSVK